MPVLCFASITDHITQEAEEEMKVKCPCGNNEVYIGRELLSLMHWLNEIPDMIQNISSFLFRLRKALFSTTVNNNFNDLTKLLVRASHNDYNSSSEKHMCLYPMILTQQKSPVGCSRYKFILTGGHDTLPQQILARTSRTLAKQY